MNAATLTLVGIALGGWALVVYSYAGYPIALALVAALHQLKADLKFVLGKAERRRQALEEEIATLWLPAEIELAKRRIGA